MRRKISALCIILSLFAVLCVSGCSGPVKEPSAAGAFYPAQDKVLEEMVDSFLRAAQVGPLHGRLIALIAPHAGYQFSGRIAAYTYKQLAERDIRTVILVGPSHYSSFSGASVYTRGSMRTPLGNVRIDEKLARSLLNEKAQVGFYPQAFEKEHSIEVQLPFLQRTLKNFRIVPILIGAPTRESFGHLTEKLKDILSRDEKAILIASTDLSHYHDYDTAMAMDGKITDAIERMSLEDVERLLGTGEGEMCGAYPVIFTMAVARALGATNGVLYAAANSGDVTPDRNRVVGYAAIGLYNIPLSPVEREKLLALAKNTLAEFVSHGKVPDINVRDPRLRANGATFVTINRNGQLRGCIGNIQPVMPLYRSVITNAISACSRDGRFRPMAKEELKDAEVEVTVLSSLQPLTNINDIRIGTHGLYIVNGTQSGILLPQVAEQYRWNANTFLQEVSVKAGLPREAWKSSQLYTFTADIIK